MKSEMGLADFIVGIDLGTTHTVLAWARADGRGGIQLHNMEQLIAPGEVAAQALLPSLRYHPAPGELAETDLALPWARTTPADGAVIGALAGRLGAQVPGRLVSSAKSWLSHAAVDRLAPILPWGAPDGVARVSPVAASASYLAHLRAAWNHHHPGQPLEHQDVALTVPASFDDAARELTLVAARLAGLARPRLLEEPQAALYDWLFRHRATLAQALAGTRLVLVVDVGGGTTDLSLVRVDHEPSDDAASPPKLERIAVGKHLMLGGDNMDLALAHLAESRLAGPRLAVAEFSQLVERCRAAKELLLADGAPERATLALLGAGARLVGGARTVELGRDEVQRLIVDGFFPQVAATDQPRSTRGAGLVTLGLPHAADPAVTRHIAAFLQQHAAAGWPDALLLNGGVFRAGSLVRRLLQTLAGWRGAPITLLPNTNPDVAVARGAVAYLLARQGLAPRIAGGSARSYFLRGDDGHAVCVLPRGSQPGQALQLQGRSFALRVGQPVQFHLVAATTGQAAAGDSVALAGLEAQPLPPLVTVVNADGAHVADGADGAAPGAALAAGATPAKGLTTSPTMSPTTLPVTLSAMLTEIGTLALQCISVDNPAQRWQLEFQLRTDAGTAASALPPHYDEAVAAIHRVFGARDRAVGPKAVKQLRAQLEALLGPRERWPTALARALFDTLWHSARGRRRSADHERLWLSLTGWCLRPGFGAALDGWRLDQLWPLFEQGLAHGHERQVQAEWWTLWRRVAGGLPETAQLRLLDDFVINLRGAEVDAAGEAALPAACVPGGWDDMVRLVATLERIPAGHKQEIGDWLVEQMRGTGALPRRDATGPLPRRDATGALPRRDATGPLPRPEAASPWTPWAIARLGARTPLSDTAHTVVPVAVAERWLDALLAQHAAAADGATGLPAALAILARLSGDRARDLPEARRAQVVAWLKSRHAPAAWTAAIETWVPLDEAAENGVFGEALPPGLRLIA